MRPKADHRISLTLRVTKKSQRGDNPDDVGHNPVVRRVRRYLTPNLIGLLDWKTKPKSWGIAGCYATGQLEFASLGIQREFEAPAELGVGSAGASPSRYACLAFDGQTRCS